MSNLNERELILKIEKEVDIEKYTFRNANIWPIIRISILLSLKGSDDSQISHSFIRKISFLFLGIYEGLKGLLGFWPHVDYIFLSSAHYKVNIKGLYYDRIIDPFLDYLEKKNTNYAVFEFTNNYNYTLNLKHKKRVIRLHPVLYFMSLKWKLEFFLFGTKDIEGDYDLLNQICREYGVTLGFKRAFKKRLFIWNKQSHFIAKILHQMQVKKAGMVCYYDFKSLTFTSACNILQIPNIDFQHGVLGSEHMAYSDWPKNIAENSICLPSHFWVWDKHSYNTILDWKNASGIIYGCNKWVYDRISKLSSNIILFSLQPITEPIPQKLFDAIKIYTGNEKWYFRLHPQQLQYKDSIKEIIKFQGLEKIINVEEATEMPLTEILAHTMVHITFFSSVVIEASYYDIPTIFLDERGPLYYSKQIASQLIKTGENHKEILAIIEEVANTKNSGFKGNKENVLNRFKAIENFLY